MHEQRSIKAWYGGWKRTGNRKTNWDHPKYKTIKIDQNAEKSSGDLRLVETQTPLKDHQFTLGGELARKNNNSDNNNDNNNNYAGVKKKKTIKGTKY